jgi:hypothetical protein
MRSYVLSNQQWVQRELQRQEAPEANLREEGRNMRMLNWDQNTPLNDGALSEDFSRFESNGPSSSPELREVEEVTEEEEEEEEEDEEEEEVEERNPEPGEEKKTPSKNKEESPPTESPGEFGKFKRFDNRIN